MNTNAPLEGDGAALLVELELRIARRADELRQMDDGRHPERDFWREAENEIWAGAFGWEEAGLAS